MSRGLEMKEPSNLSKIDTNNLSEFIWWCAHLGISPEELLSIITRVGNSVEVIRVNMKRNI